MPAGTVGGGGSVVIAHSLSEAKQMSKQIRPDLILLAFRLPDSQDADTLPAIRDAFPLSKVVMVTGLNNAFLQWAREQGADAVVSKAEPFDSLVSAISDLFGHRAPNPSAWASLSEREREVARLAASGLTNRQIAAAISRSPNTVKTHLKSAMQKLGVRSRVSLASIRENHQVLGEAPQNHPKG